MKKNKKTNGTRLRSLIDYVSSNSPKKLFSDLQRNIRALSFSLGEAIRLEGAIIIRGIRSAWLLIGAILLELVVSIKWIFRRVWRAVINTFKLFQLMLISYTCEINPYWSTCAKRADEVFIRQSELNSLFEKYILHLSDRILTHSGQQNNHKIKRREIALSILSIILGGVRLLLATAKAIIMSILYIVVIFVPIYSYLGRGHSLHEDFKAEPVPTKSDLNPEEGYVKEYVEIESFLDSSNQQDDKQDKCAYVIRRGFIPRRKSMPIDATGLRETQFLILSYEWRCASKTPTHGTSYYFMCMRDTEKGWHRSLSNSFTSAKSAIEKCESIFKGIIWVLKRE
ncbi:hypothetical protein NZK33_04945 [Cyanobium sp. FGCU-6]|nr:hypothetical protein [Cyanobium sp. FGCU6]